MKALFILSIFFLVFVNLLPFVDGNLGGYIFIAHLGYLLVFITLLVGGVWQFYLSVKESFINRKRLFILFFIVGILGLVWWRPDGLINRDFFMAKSVLEAGRWSEGGNCSTNLVLREDLSFVERGFCFGTEEIKGRYYLKNDTIYFRDAYGRGAEEYYAYAIFESTPWDSSKIWLVRYRRNTQEDSSPLFIAMSQLK